MCLSFFCPLDQPCKTSQIVQVAPNLSPPKQFPVGIGNFARSSFKFELSSRSSLKFNRTLSFILVFKI